MNSYMKIIQTPRYNYSGGLLSNMNGYKLVK